MRTILFLAVLSSGCSIAVQGKPGAGASRTDCSTSIVPPAVDMAAVGASVAALVASIVKADDWGDGGATLGGAGAMGAVLFTASGTSGIRVRSACLAKRNESITAVAAGK